MTIALYEEFSVVYIAQVVDFIFRLLGLLVLVHVILSYFMSPFHPVRQQLDRIVEPMLAPIRRVVPHVGMIDFSPVILLILLQIAGNIIVRLLLTF
ncbi:MAG: YggT family protein [Anaerolineae bacterium]|nr:YggT family protein [Anaerolineae bacterium]